MDLSDVIAATGRHPVRLLRRPDGGPGAARSTNRTYRADHNSAGLRKSLGVLAAASPDMIFVAMSGPLDFLAGAAPTRPAVDKAQRSGVNVPTPQRTPTVGLPLPGSRVIRRADRCSYHHRRPSADQVHTANSGGAVLLVLPVVVPTAQPRCSSGR